MGLGSGYIALRHSVCRLLQLLLPILPISLRREEATWFFLMFFHVVGCLGVITSGGQGLFLALHSGITPDSWGDQIGYQESIQISHMQSKCCPCYTQMMSLAFDLQHQAQPGQLLRFV